jgi:hypothetical protein
MAACSCAHYVHVLLYYCLFDLNTEIKEVVVVICFSLCKLRGCKLRGGVNLQEMFKLKTRKTNGCKTRPGCICNQIFLMKLTNILCVAGPPSLFIKTDMFPPLKGHYQGVRTFIQRSTQSNTVMHKQYVII